MKSDARTIVLGVLGLCSVAGIARIEPAVGDTQTPEAMQEQLVAQERAGLDALKSGNVTTFASLIGEDAVFVDDHGPATKAQVVKNVGDFKLLEYAMDDVRLVRVSDSAGLIVYKLTERGSSHGREFAATVYVSTLYALRGGKWLPLFSQETAARRVPPVTPAAAPVAPQPK